MRTTSNGDPEFARGPQLTVGLLGHSISSANLGVGALTLSNIAIVEKVARDLNVPIRFLLIASLDTGEPYFNKASLESLAIRTRSFLAPRGGLWDAVRRCDVVLDITGGDSFADIYGVSRFLRASAAKAIVLLASRPLILSPQTIGPFQRRWTEWIAIGLMRRARAVVARDRLTIDYLRPFKLGERLIESSDVAFRLPYQPPPKHSDSRVCVGLNISGLLFNGGYTGRNMFGLSVDYPELARALVVAFTSRSECEVHLISHVISSDHAIEDDYRISEQLAAEFPGVVVAPRFSDPSEAKSYIAGMEFFVGSRMHACIAALSSGVPVLPLAYSRKFAGVFGSLGYPPIADCRSQSIAEIVVMSIESYERRYALQSNVAAAKRKADEMLSRYEALLTEHFAAHLKLAR